MEDIGALLPHAKKGYYSIWKIMGLSEIKPIDRFSLFLTHTHFFFPVYIL